MSAICGNTAGPGVAVVNVYIDHEKKFAFVEMRSVEEASNAIALDGIMFEGAPVKVNRPSDYNKSLAATLGPSEPNSNLNLAAVGLQPGSPAGIEAQDSLFFDRSSDQDLSVTDIACAALNGLKIGNKILMVRRANEGQTQPKPELESILFLIL